MLEGLEVSEVKLNDIGLHHRLDSEFYSKKFRLIAEVIKSKPHLRFGNACTLIDGPFGSDFHSSGYVDDGVPILRMQNIKQIGLFDDNGIEFVSESDAEILQKHTAYPGDIVTTKIGFLGYTAVLPDTYNKYIFRRELTRIVINDNRLNPACLSTFLNCAYGRAQAYQHASGTTRDRVLLINQREFLIPLFQIQFQDTIEICLKQSRQKDKQAADTYAQAATLLLNALNLANFSPSTENSNIKSFQESFGLSGRLDAEYYQLKYEQLVAEITSQSHARLTDLVGIKKSIEPGSDAYSEDETGLPFLRVADYNRYGLTNPQKRLNVTFVVENSNELEVLKPKKDTILFSKDGSVGEAYCLREDGNFITSGAVLHLTVRDPKVILPEYLTLVLNSKVVKMQAERDAGGSIILHWRVGEIENVVVPLVDMPTQSKIASLVRQSFTLKAESERLLEVAKHAVEVAIEQDEQAALAYIQMRQL